ncbi:MAG TPA: cytochrome ubiquinol oxidase subunit I [Usitatibacter sp.]|jgi:cytochrome d ubiquinol oxidase subunit I|nr:cytochrome ubiquinol oxidase subunit I [Usitatibacter sp.]
MDQALLLSRLQFAWVIALHILLPAFTVGLAAYIAVLEGLFFFGRRPVFLRLSRYWLRIFAVSFGMGVVSGIVMPFQFGTNWSRYSEITGGVTGPLMAYEVLTAFFLEAGFLGILLFGRDKVPPWVHFFAGVMVAGGTLLSTFWILAANSWMQTPAGYGIVDGRFVPVDWWKAVFTPSFPYRLVHTTMAFFITTAFAVIGVAAYHLRHDRYLEESVTMQKMGFGLLAILVPLQVFIGDQHGLNTLEYQPVKIAAIEANWETQSHMPLLLFAWPDERAERNDFEVAIPELGSLILRHHVDGVVPGLKDWKPGDRPPVAIPFFSFRIMVGIGLAMLAMTLAGLWVWYRGRLSTTRWFQRLCLAAMPLGFIAVIAGWVTTEVGRQPWVVYGLLRTRDAVTPSLRGGDVTVSILVYIAAYIVIFGSGVYFLARLARGGFGPAEPDLQPFPTQKRPISGATRVT